MAARAPEVHIHPHCCDPCSLLISVIFALLVGIPGFANQAPQGTPAGPMLTLEADVLNPLPNQQVHFTLRSKLYRVDYYFLWGDGAFTKTEQLMADHAYSVPGPYKVQVRAESKAMAAHIPPIFSNELTIDVVAPPVAVQSVLTLVPDRPVARVVPP